MPPRRSVAYPTNHLLAVVDAPAAADEAVRAVTEAGIPASDVTQLRGDGAAQGIGGLGARHSWLTAIIRAVQYLTMDQMPDFGRYEQAIAEGRTVIAVHAPERAAMLRARDVLVAHGAHFLNFYGRVATEELGRWREPHDGWIEKPFPDAEARKGRR